MTEIPRAFRWVERAGVDLPTTLFEGVEVPRRTARAAARIVMAHTLERAPSLWVRWAGYRAWTGTEYRPDTDLVIEGFPGSANSYLRAWIHFANYGTHFTSHQHSPAVIARAIQQHRPIVVVAREPVAAVASTLLRFPEMAGWPEGPRRLLKRYRTLYRPALARRGLVAVATFRQAIEEPELIVARVNSMFGSSINALPPGHEDEVLAYLRSLEPAEFTTLGMAAPDEDRRAAAEALVPAIEATAGPRVVAAARRTYQELCAMAGDQVSSAR